MRPSAHFSIRSRLTLTPSRTPVAFDALKQIQHLSNIKYILSYNSPTVKSVDSGAPNRARVQLCQDFQHRLQGPDYHQDLFRLLLHLSHLCRQRLLAQLKNRLLCYLFRPICKWKSWKSILASFSNRTTHASRTLVSGRALMACKQM
ncbi:hypothetical protein TYRP_018835 [Tyrophagus putrescentiae]|nr:hypothetical protein TYRP_018835 [Tyrophagus putrescentiae]